MRYFRDLDKITYKFGNEASTVVTTDITTYVDIIDQLKDEISIYNYYNVQEGERPDHLSQLLYQTPAYHWTFYLLNDSLRVQGWPLSNKELHKKLLREYSNTTIVTKTNIGTVPIAPGTEIEGQSSGAIGVVIHRNLDLGQITVRGKRNFTAGENIIQRTDDGSGSLLCIVDSSSVEYNAAHHYIDGNSDWTDIDPHSGPGAQDTAVTIYEHYFNENDALRQIKIIKPSYITDIVANYKQAIGT